MVWFKKKKETVKLNIPKYLNFTDKATVVKYATEISSLDNEGLNSLFELFEFQALQRLHSIDKEMSETAKAHIVGYCQALTGLRSEVNNLINLANNILKSGDDE